MITSIRSLPLQLVSEPLIPDFSMYDNAASVRGFGDYKALNTDFFAAFCKEPLESTPPNNSNLSELEFDTCAMEAGVRQKPKSDFLLNVFLMGENLLNSVTENFSFLLGGTDHNDKAKKLELKTNSEFKQAKQSHILGDAELVQKHLNGAIQATEDEFLIWKQRGHLVNSSLVYLSAAFNTWQIGADSKCDYFAEKAMDRGLYWLQSKNNKKPVDHLFFAFLCEMYGDQMILLHGSNEESSKAYQWAGNSFMKTRDRYMWAREYHEAYTRVLDKVDLLDRMVS